MNIALIIAGGSGKRTGNSVPKQFMTVNDKPIIIYTMENIEAVKEIDKIVVVSSSGWENFIYTYADQYKITKLDNIILGGEDRFNSMYNGVNYIYQNFPKDSNIIFVDANRPLIPRRIFTDGINKLNENGGCILTVEPCYDSMFYSEKEGIVEKPLNRNLLFKGQTPEFTKTAEAKEIFDKAIKEGISGPVTELYLKNGKSVKQVLGSPLSLKITVKEDFEIFKALLQFNQQN